MRVRPLAWGAAQRWRAFPAHTHHPHAHPPSKPPPIPPRPTPPAPRLGIQPNGPHGCGFYSFSPHPGWRVVVLDSYDVSLLDAAQGAGHPLRAAAEAVMAANPNANKHSPEGLEGLAKRFVEFGGGVSPAQLGWLRRQLAGAAAAGQRALVAGHVPFCPGTCPEPCVLVRRLQEGG